MSKLDDLKIMNINMHKFKQNEKVQYLTMISVSRRLSRIKF